MPAHRIYVSASTQDKNVGVGQYGTEQDRMQQLADRIAFWLKTQKGRFEVFRNQSGWTLEQTVNDCNKLACQLFFDNHTNAGASETVAGDGGAEGTEVYYYGQGGTTCKSYQFAQILYKYIAPLSLGKDRGVKPDTALYPTGLYVIQHTDPPAVLIEHIFHTNYAEVDDFLKRIDEFAKATAKAVVEFFNEKWEEPVVKERTIESLVDELFKDGIITDKIKWINVLSGKESVNLQYLQIAFSRAVSKI